MAASGSSLTFFAPPERAPSTQVTIEHRSVAERVLKEAFDATVSPTAVLNAQRQVVFCNRALVGLIEGLDPQEVWGARLGEALQCVRVKDAPGGCGTSEFCRICGTVLAILEGQKGLPATRECRLVRRVRGQEEALDLRVTVSPLPIFDRFVVCSIEDIGDEKRRHALERVFFHDALNTAFALQTQAQVLASLPLNLQAAQLANRLRRNAVQLVSELDSQRLLLAAERNDLATNPVVIPTSAILEGLRDQWRDHQVAADKHLVLAPSDDVRVRADCVLLNRVLGNMVRNAFEASAEDDTVTIGCRRCDESVEFWAHNVRPLTPDEERQVFQRSFSTKGPDRGLGTYGMKLLTERYLQGGVRVVSSASEGTTFYVRVPVGDAE